MEEKKLYPVCPHRNVPAAYERFHGPDSGGIERFFCGECLRIEDAFAALACVCERFERRAAIYGAAAHALLTFAWLATRFYGPRLARGWSKWAAHPQLPLLLGSRPILALAA
jgi:hypothetical protein